MESGSVPRRQTLCGDSQTRGNCRAERLGSRHRIAELLRRAAPAGAREWQMNPERFRHIEELYHAARKREPSQRSAFLAEACRGDEELRRKVELLLAQDA